MELKTKRPMVTAGVMLLCAGLIMVYLASVFSSQHEEEPFYPGPGVTEIRMLSDYLPTLKDTVVDTEIYVLEGKEPGASMLVMGGTHPREPGGMVAAVTLLENAVPEKGTLYVIPRVNKSAYTFTEPQEATPMRFTIETPNGTRWFRASGREINPIHQWPDPEVYIHPSGLTTLSGKETRNVNRVYPGSPDGTLAERICYGIISFIKAENIDVALDLHEGDAIYQSMNAMIVHQRALDLAATAAFNLSFEDVEISIQESPEMLRGFFHREVGDATDTMAVLAEALNPEQGRVHGRKTADLIVEGKDKYGVLATSTGLFMVKFTEEGSPLKQRVARHVETARQLAAAYNEMGYGETLEFWAPSYHEIMENGLGAYLMPPA
jgi:predicted deacylase